MGALEQRYPALAGLEGHRLRDVRPYYLPASGRLTWLLCRWPDGAPVPVSLPSGLSEAETRALEAALAGWERTLGLRFERRAAGELGGEGIEIRLLEDFLPVQANTVAECAVDAAALSNGSPSVLPARIVFASIHLARGDPRLAGTALHELGHALGFQGHPSAGDTAMVSGTGSRLGKRSARRSGSIRRGDRILAGDTLRDGALEALYAVPSGVVLGRASLPPGRTAAVDALLVRASAEGWRGPLLRVGDDEGRVAWRDRSGQSIGIRLTHLDRAETDPSALGIEPEP